MTQFHSFTWSHPLTKVLPTIHNINLYKRNTVVVVIAGASVTAAVVLPRTTRSYTWHSKICNNKTLEYLLPLCPSCNCCRLSTMRTKFTVRELVVERTSTHHFRCFICRLLIGSALLMTVVVDASNYHIGCGQPTSEPSAHAN